MNLERVEKFCPFMISWWMVKKKNVYRAYYNLFFNDALKSLECIVLFLLMEYYYFANKIKLLLVLINNVWFFFCSNVKLSLSSFVVCAILNLLLYNLKNLIFSLSFGL